MDIVFISASHPEFIDEPLRENVHRCNKLRLWADFPGGSHQQVWVIVTKFHDDYISELHFRESDCRNFFYIGDEETK